MTNRLIHGDCLKIPLPPNYFDTLITDPPYGLGFMGKNWDAGVPGKVFWKKFLDTCKPGAFAFVFGGTRTYHRLACAIEDAGWEIRDCMMWLYGSGFPKSLDISKAIDKAVGAKGEVVGKPFRPSGLHRGKIADYSPKNSNEFEPTITAPATDLAKQWDGYGTALKPAWEPIIVAMKPLDGTFAHNAEKWGVGGLWIDGGRIGDNPGYKYNADKNGTTFHGQQGERILQTAEKKGQQFIESSKGRWPANVILDEEAGTMLDAQTGNLGKSAGGKSGHTGAYGGGYKEEFYGDSKPGFGDSGGASRFFYCAKASKRERGEGNSHCTVKPLALMEYLCKLSRTPQGGIVLDPFAGSGTTALACANTDRQYVVIEKEREYCEIIAARLGGAPIETTTPQRPRLYNA